MRRELLIEKFNPSFIDGKGNSFWYNAKGQVHRVGDDPAIIYANGTMRWYKNGKRHRNGDKPSFIESNGTMWWHKNDLIHRDNDKPAVVRANGSMGWYKDGKQYVPENHEQIICTTPDVILSER